MECPNSSTGAHNFQLRTHEVGGHTVVVRVCVLCGAEG